MDEAMQLQEQILALVLVVRKQTEAIKMLNERVQVLEEAQAED